MAVYCNDRQIFSITGLASPCSPMIGMGPPNGEPCRNIECKRIRSGTFRDQLKHRIPKHDMVDFLDVFDFGPTVIGTCTDNFFKIRVLGELFRDMIDAKIKNLEFLLALSVDNGIRRLRSGPFKCIDGCRNPLSVIG